MTINVATISNPKNTNVTTNIASKQIPSWKAASLPNVKYCS
ncbi:unnamed protein product [Schistosoma mattheei]|uniref:Uncharacterized protein n=1 Tax=Schistosoma mattheei TaxID=31246 RepID=A0A183Q8I8_9TREM|nr:unnamed protein product [Schistosoma mattheei]